LEDMEKMATLHEYGRLEKYLKEQGELDQLEGWLGTMLKHYGTKVVDDHSMWPYFARRFGLVVIGHLEPRPGVPPTTAHLQTLGQQMQQQKVRLILANPYFNPRHASTVASSSGASVVSMAHQVGARTGTDNYISMVDYNVRQLAEALDPKR
jgi:ABC-type Zn uptake system ZnuABC Zn-binding protein ZnuA